MIVNIYAPNYIKQILTDDTNTSDGRNNTIQIQYNTIQCNKTIIVEEFNMLLSTMDRSSRQEINKKTLDLNYILNYIYLTDIYIAFHLIAAEYAFFSSTYGTFSRIHHVLCHKITLSKYKKNKIIPTVFSDQNNIKLEINNRRKTHRLMEIIQRTPKQPIDQRRNQREVKKS